MMSDKELAHREFLLTVVDMQRLTIDAIVDKVNESDIPQNIKDQIARCNISMRVLETMAKPRTKSAPQKEGTLKFAAEAGELRWE